MKILFISVVILGIGSTYYYFFDHNGSFLISELYILFGFFKTFIHEFGHGIAGIISGGEIEKIDMSLFSSEAISKGTLGVCYCSSSISIFSKVFMSYSGHLSVFLSLMIFSYFYGIGKSEYIFLIFSFMSIVYSIKGYELSDVIFGLFLTILCLGIFLGKFFKRVKNIKDIIGVILLGFLFSGTIQEILNLTFGSENKIGSDSYHIFESTLIPQFLTITSWIIIAIFSLSISYSFIFGKLNIAFFDKINERIHKLLRFKTK